MDEYPRDLVLLMDELSPIDFCRLAFYKLNKIKINTINELEELEKVMCKAMDLSTKMKLNMLSPALKDRFFKVLSEKGLDKPPSLLANIALEHSKQPGVTNRPAPTVYIEENQPKLFQNTSKPVDVDPNSYKPSPKSTSPPHSGPPIKRDQDPYKSGMLELDAIKQGQAKGRQQYRNESPSPPRAYRARSQSRPRESRRSRSPPSYKGRSSSRPRRSRTRSPPSMRSYPRYDDRRSKSPPPSRSYSQRSHSPSRRSPPSVRSFNRRSRSPPSVRSRRSRSPPSVRSFSRKSRSPPSVREVPKEEDREEEEGGARKGGLSFSLMARKKIPPIDKPSFKFT